jgi:hypothetical protein
MLLVTEPAEDLQLLTEEELRVAAGLEPDDDSQDEALAIYGVQASTALAAACGVAVAGYAASSTASPLRGAAPRTLHAETLVETMRVRPGWQYRDLFLARWPVLEIISVTEGSTELTADDWELDVPMGTLLRLSSGEACYWACGIVTVEYEAGYDEIPADLKGYAARLVSLYSQTIGSDPNQKRVEIPGVITIDRWVDQTKTDAIVPDDIKNGLVRDGYRRPVLA